LEVINFILFLYGCIFGSFFNVVGLRVPVGKSIVVPRSSCPSCGHQLAAFELVPVVSYLMLGGRCRVCKERISPLYPVFELLTGILFAAAPVFFSWSGEMIVALTLISLFMIITVSDLHYMIIPDKILLVFAGIFLLERIVWPLNPWWDSLVGAMIGFTLLLLIAFISGGGMGGGDIKLFALIGFVLGVKLMLLSFFLATLYGALFGVLSLLARLVKRRQPIPFGPFIAAGTFTAYFWGPALIEFYLRFLGRG
jgi:leader peptidase (prepilin peptidase) / N-methyltransferase